MNRDQKVARLGELLTRVRTRARDALATRGQAVATAPQEVALSIKASVGVTTPAADESQTEETQPFDRRTFDRPRPSLVTEEAPTLKSGQVVASPAANPLDDLELRLPTQPTMQVDRAGSEVELELLDEPPSSSKRPVTLAPSAAATPETPEAPEAAPPESGRHVMLRPLPEDTPLLEADLGPLAVEQEARSGVAERPAMEQIGETLELEELIGEPLELDEALPVVTLSRRSADMEAVLPQATAAPGVYTPELRPQAEPAAPLPEAHATEAPTALRIEGQLVRVAPADKARIAAFAGQARTFRPQSFLELLDASLEL